MIESPFTKVPNSILDIEALDIYEFRILMHIIRKTLGFNKKSDGISLSQFVKATGISKSKVTKTIESLNKKKFITVQKQTNKSGGKSFNRYIALVSDKDHLYREKTKGSTPQGIALVSDRDIQKKIEQKKIDNREKERLGVSIYYDLSDNEKLRETDKYISHVIQEEGFIKNEKSFKLKVKRQLVNEDKFQLEDFEKWYLKKECEILKEKYVGKYLENNQVSNIYPYFVTEKYDPTDKFILWFDKDEEFSFHKCFSSKTEIEEFLEEIEI